MQVGRLGFSLAVLPSTSKSPSIREGPMKILSTSALAAIVAFGAIAGSAPSEAQETMTKEKLIGPWRLVSFKATAGDKVSYPLGETSGRVY